MASELLFRAHDCTGFHRYSRGYIGLGVAWLAAGIPFGRRCVRSRELLADLDQRFDTTKIGYQMHRWAGSAGQLGFHNITELVRRVESLLSQAAPRLSELREMLSELLSAFSPSAGQANGGRARSCNARPSREKMWRSSGFPEEQRPPH